MTCYFSEYRARYKIFHRNTSMQMTTQSSDKVLNFFLEAFFRHNFTIIKRNVIMNSNVQWNVARLAASLMIFKKGALIFFGIF